MKTENAQSRALNSSLSPLTFAMEPFAKKTQVTPHSYYTFVTEVHEGEQSGRITLQPLSFLK